MKKLLLFLCAFALAAAAYAQTCSTVSNFNFGTNTPTLLPSSPWGFVSGHNNWDDRAKADYFTAASGDTIKSAILYFSKAFSGNGTSTADVKIWNGSTGTPGAELASVTIPISSISTTDSTLVNFSPPVVVTGNFFCGIQFPANGIPQDTVALFTNQNGNTNPGTGWELWNDATWHAYSAAESWNINVAHMIKVKVCSSIICTISITGTVTDAGTPGVSLPEIA